MQSYVTLVHNTRSSRPEVVVSVNYALRYEDHSFEIRSKKSILLFSDIEAKHLQLSVDQLDKSPIDHPHSMETDKCSSTNTSLNSTSSSSISTSSNHLPSKLIKTKQRKSSLIKVDSHDYSSYYPDEHYYTPNSTPSNYSNLALYAATVGNYSNTSDPTMYYDQKRMRIDSDHPSHPIVNYENEKFDYYSPNHHCYTSTNYPPEHSYHHTSVIVDSQQYFLNGWNGTTAF